MTRIYLLTLFLGVQICTQAQEAAQLLQKMSLEEKVGQLFMVAAYSNRGEEHVEELTHLVKESKIGGLIYFQGGPIRQVNQLRQLQSMADVPLLVSMDAEWGVSMRLDSTIRYPRQMTLGAITDVQLIEDMGTQIAKECQVLGVHMNLAPVVDVNNNPKNPVIGNRSFGEDPFQVARRGRAYMEGMQKQGVMACFKHFPGHGDTDKDSHLSLPTVEHGVDRLQEVEWVPFKDGIKRGVDGMMVAHLFMPQLDTTTNRASTLSPTIVQGWLRDSLGFEGLIFTDALNMKGVAHYYAPGEVDKLAFMAGNDVLLFSEDVDLGIQKIVEAVKKGEIAESRVDASCLRILEAKEKQGLLQEQAWADKKQIQNTLHGKEARKLKRKLFENAITLIQNKQKQFPLKSVGNQNRMSIAIDADEKTAFQKTLDLYGRFTHHQVAQKVSRGESQKLMALAKEAGEVVLAIQAGSNNPNSNYGFDLSTRNLALSLSKVAKVHLVCLTNPYALMKLDDPSRFESISIGYQNDQVMQEVAAEALFGGIPYKGELPISISDQYPKGKGIITQSVYQLGMAHPKELEINASLLARVDSLALDAIDRKATPGLRIMASRYGRVFYDKSFGKYTYSGNQNVEPQTVFDLASITKVASTTSIIMQLVEEGKLDIFKHVGYYLDFLPDTTDHKNMLLVDLLTHQSGLQSWIPFYQRWLESEPNEVWSRKADGDFNQPLAKNLFSHKSIQDSIFNIIFETPFRDQKEYKYSDLGFYFLKSIIEKVEGKSLDLVFQDRIALPLGLSTMQYNPLKQRDKYGIAPTEFDSEFRKQLIQGFVHDPGAALMGGVGGHAGLFSSAPDLLKLVNSYLYPQYSGIWSPETVAFFTTSLFSEMENRRGVGFDKPVLEPGPGPAFEGAPLASFGHSGFTGTLFWADPETGLAVVFLSNRVYPSATNNLLAKKDYRSKTVQYFFEALNDWSPEDSNKSLSAR